MESRERELLFRRSVSAAWQGAVTVSDPVAGVVAVDAVRKVMVSGAGLAVAVFGDLRPGFEADNEVGVVG